MEIEKKNYLVVNFKTKEIIENKLEPISNFMLVKIAKVSWTEFVKAYAILGLARMDNGGCLSQR